MSMIVITIGAVYILGSVLSVAILISTTHGESFTIGEWLLLMLIFGVGWPITWPLISCIEWIRQRRSRRERAIHTLANDDG